MIRKARDNLHAANILMGWKLSDSVANRLYYAVYHAAWAFMEERNRPVPDQEGRRYFRHDTMNDILEEEGFGQSLGLQEDWQAYWEELRSLRVKADYFPDSVALRDLDTPVFDFVNAVVKKVGRFRNGQ